MQLTEREAAFAGMTKTLLKALKDFAEQAGIRPAVLNGALRDFLTANGLKR